MKFLPKIALYLTHLRFMMIDQKIMYIMSPFNIHHVIMLKMYADSSALHTDIYVFNKD